MNLEIDKDFMLVHVLPRFPQDSELAKKVQRERNYGSTTISVKVSSLTVDELEMLYGVAKDQQDKRLMSQITAYRSLMKNPSTAKISSIGVLEAGFAEYFKQNVIDGWLYNVDESKIPHAYLIQRVKYEPASSRDDNPQVVVSLVANSAKATKKDVYTITLHFDQMDISGKTIPEILAKKGYYHETPEFKSVYEEHLAAFMKYQPMTNQQFWVQGTVYTSFDYRNERAELRRSKAVNDEGIVGRKIVETTETMFWGDDQKEVPFHSFIYMFHLAVHQNVWVHASNMVPYEYNKSLRDKLVLPDDHRDLIDILVEDMDILQDDIIEGKSGGTTILCVGAPGLGKTLSAEVYSEVVERVLYRVHSGQLGIKPDEVEKNLEAILKRAARWGAVLLIDEADVYIRQRGNDIQHNAVVAAFLRTLEYFSGLLFMTTNRSNDVDDAILSRCIAVIKYVTPTADNAKRIWKVLSTQFQVQLNDGLIDELVQKFPNASGRDIKELLKLTSRYAKGKDVKISLDAFRQCAQFRGLA